MSIWKKASVYTLSICSAIFHAVGQVAMAAIIYMQIGMMTYLPMVIIPSIIAGFLIGFVAAMVIKQLEKNHFKVS